MFQKVKKFGAGVGTAVSKAAVDASKAMKVIPTDPEELYSQAQELEKSLDKTHREAEKHKSASVLGAIKQALTLESTHKRIFNKYREAAKLGHARSQYKYAFYLQAQGDENVAFEWYQKSAEQGVPESMKVLGEFYTFGKGGAAVNHKRALAWVTRAVEAGNEDAHALLGRLYLQGEGIERSAAKALEHLNQVVYVSMDATALLGLMYYNGSGVEANRPLALSLFKTVAEVSKEHRPAIQSDVIPETFPGEAEAIYLLGRMFEEGDSIEPNVEEAIEFYHLAAQYGSAEAMYHLAQAYRDGKAKEQNKKLAQFWFEEAGSYAFGKNSELEAKIQAELKEVVDMLPSAQEGDDKECNVREEGGSSPVQETQPADTVAQEESNKKAQQQNASESEITGELEQQEPTDVAQQNEKSDEAQEKEASGNTQQKEESVEDQQQEASVEDQQQEASVEDQQQEASLKVLQNQGSSEAPQRVQHEAENS